VEFFNKVGFHVVERGVLPLKAWKDCLRCPKFHACDETAMLRILRPEHWCEGSQPQSWVTEADSYIQLPTPQQA
jgi:amino-acid N-acetyltransferase